MKLKILSNFFTLVLIFLLSFTLTLADTKPSDHTPYALTAAETTPDDNHSYGSARLTFKIDAPLAIPETAHWLGM